MRASPAQTYPHAGSGDYALSPGQYQADDAFSAGLGRLVSSAQHQRRVLGWLVGLIAAGEVGDLALVCAGIEALGVAPAARRERRVDVDLEEACPRAAAQRRACGRPGRERPAPRSRSGRHRPSAWRPRRRGERSRRVPAGSKPRSALRPCRRLSPSSSMVCLPSSASLRSTRVAMVDLPEPGRPVSQTTGGSAPFDPSAVRLVVAVNQEVEIVLARNAVAMLDQRAEVPAGGDVQEGKGRRRGEERLAGKMQRSLSARCWGRRRCRRGNHSRHFCRGRRRSSRSPIRRRPPSP